MPELYIAAAMLLVIASCSVLLKSQRGLSSPKWFLMPFSVILAITATIGVYVYNYDFLKLWVSGEEVYFAIRTPFNVSAPHYYVVSLVLMISPILLVLPVMLKRPWLVAFVAAIATFPITYAKLTGGC